MSIHFTPNMSYCAVENTASAMDQVIALMEEYDTVEQWRASLNEYELRGLESLLQSTERFREYTEQFDSDLV